MDSLVSSMALKQHSKVPIGLLTDAPQYRPQGVKPQWLDELQSQDLDSIPLPDSSPSEILMRLLGSPNIASRESVYRRYDYQVQTNTVVAPGGDSAVLRLKGTTKGIAAATDGNGRYCYLDPYTGGMIAVAEVCRNISCSGAEPIALTDCLNFGNPERPEIYYQLEECVKGIAHAARTLNVPVISGNVSLYNEAQDAIYPTPIIGGLGVLDNVDRHATTGFKDSGDLVFLLGASSISDDASSLAGSEYLEFVHGVIAGQPTIDIELETAVQRACRRLIGDGIVRSAHDCSDGGLAVALTESCIAGGTGFAGDFTIAGRWDAALFGEVQSRIIVSISPKSVEDFHRICQAEGVPTVHLGVTGGDRLAIDSGIDVPIDTLSSVWGGGLEDVMTGGPA